MPMNTDMMIARLYQDTSLIAELNGGQAEQLLSWAEGRVQECETEAEFDRFLKELRLLNRYVAQGSRFEHLLAMLRQEALRERGTGFMPRGDSWSGTFPAALLF